MNKTTKNLSVPHDQSLSRRACAVRLACDVEPLLLRSQVEELTNNLAQVVSINYDRDREFFEGAALDMIAHRIAWFGWPDLDDRRRCALVTILVDQLMSPW